MPNTPSAKKALRQNKKRRARNQAAKSRMRTQLKKALAAIAQGDRERAILEARGAASLLDKCARRNIISKNCAARKKSRLAKRLNALLAEVA